MKKIKTTLKALTFTLTLSALSPYAIIYGAPQMYEVAKGQVEFKAKGFPTFITISGKSPKVMGELNLNENKASGTFKLPLASLKTGMDLRDEHMTEKYLEVGKYPEATLTLKPFDLKEEGEAMGVLKLHNVEKTIPITYTSQRDGNTIQVKTDFNLVLNDFEIDIPSFQGITVAKDIKLEVEFTARAK